MKRLSRREWALIAVVPALILAAVGAGGEREADDASIAEARPTTKPAGAAKQPAAAEAIQLTLPERIAVTDEPRDAFTKRSWYVPPPPPPRPPKPPPPPPPPPPTAPPLPFTYLGQYQEAGERVFFLVRGDSILTVKKGDVLEAKYRVDGVLGSTLGITYLPLNIRQTLNVGGAG